MASSSDSEEDAVQSSNLVIKTTALDVLYCGVCGLPPEYCEFGPKFSKCKPWLIEHCPDLYPHLKVEEEKKKTKSKQPAGTLQYWPEIGQFHHIKAKNASNVEEIRYRGKIKLHGTNVAVSIQHEGTQMYVQSRNSFLDRGNKSAHHGFAVYAYSYEAYFKSLFQKEHGYHLISIFGEWAGKGIMKGAAICNINDHIWAIFGIQLDDLLIIDPDKISSFLHQTSLPIPSNLHVIPFVTEEIKLNFSSYEDLVEPVNRVNKLVDEIDKEDPWVKEVFGVQGPGEGLVWYPVSKCDENGQIPMSSMTSLIFKTKGVTHSVVSSKQAAQLIPQVAQNVSDFADMFLTEQRLEQGLQEKCRGYADTKNMGTLIQWVLNDIKKESELELEQSGLQWEQVSQELSQRAKKWCLEKMRTQKT